MSKRRSLSIKLVLKITGSIVSIGIMIYLLRQSGWKETLSALRSVAWWCTLLGFTSVCISRLATVGRWHLLLRALDVKIPIRQTFSLTFAGLFAVNFLPTSVGGDVARLAGAVNLGCDSARSAASLVLDRIIGLAGFMFVIPFAIPGFLEKVHVSFSHMPGMLMLAGPTDTEWDKKHRIIHSIRKFATDSIKALALGMKRPGYLLGALCFTFVHMLCFFSTVWLIIAGVGEHMSFWTVAMLWSIVYVATLMPFSINGLGWQEISVTYVFTHADDVFANAGRISFGTAVAVAVLMRVFMVVASLPGAVLIPSIVTARNRHSAD